MISTFDGAITLGGRSGALAGPADRRVFQVLRSWADVIVVGAGTARAEGYGPARLGGDLRAARLARGQTPVPPIAVVTLSGNLGLRPTFFTEAKVRPIVVTAAGAGEAAVRGDARVTGSAEVLVAGHDSVDLALALDELARAGHRSVLLEGGPRLNAEVVHSGLLDELCLTLSPRLVAGSGPRVVAGPELDPPLGVEVTSLLEEDGFLFFRLTVAAERQPAPERRPPGSRRPLTT
jgi:riboflavin biosynthesis pyrimidine reductase